MDIDAIEARKLTNNQITRQLDKCSPSLVAKIMERIKDAAEAGRSVINLNSISDNGDGIRGLGMYLTGDVANALCEILKEKGFAITYVDGTHDRNKCIEVSW